MWWHKRHFWGRRGEQVARLVGAGNEQLAGNLTAHATLEMTGETSLEALKASRSHAVLAMTEGRVARALLEKASTDLRALFREGKGWAELTCVLRIVDLANGRSGSRRRRRR